MNTEVVSEETKIIKCELCSKEFSHNRHLKQHVIHVHEGVKFKCDKCIKEFSSKVHLKNHQQRKLPRNISDLFVTFPQLVVLLSIPFVPSH